jgi:hypothetical protein
LAQLEGSKGLRLTSESIIGAILEEVPKEGEDLKFQGSALIALASSKEEVLEKLKEDVYVKNGVWDLSKVWLK